MTYYDLSIDIVGTSRQQITVPTGEDFAVRIQLLKNGVRAKYIKRNAADAGTLAEANWVLPTSSMSELIDNTAYKASPSGYGNDAYMTCFFRGSDVASSKSITFQCDRWNSANEEGIVSGTTMYNPHITSTLDVVFIAQTKRCDGPDYNVVAVSGVEAKSAQLHGLSVSYLAPNQGGVADVLDVTEKKARLNAHANEKYTFSGMQMNNANGFIELSGNVCFNQDMTSNASMRNASNVFFLDHYSKYVKIAEVTIEGQTLSVLQVLPCPV